MKRFKFEGLILTIVAIVITFGLIELCSTVYLQYLKLPSLGRTPGDKLTDEQMVVYRTMFPDLDDAGIKSLFFTYREVYEPWVGFRNEDIREPLANAEGLIRHTEPALVGKDEVATDIFFFGGSTMQGVHVPDGNTLPSEFMKLAAQDPALSLRARNYGQPYYYSKQEAMLFLSLLMDGEKPRYAVFLDGLNDFVQPGASYARIPIWAPVYQWVMSNPYELSTFENIAIRYIDAFFSWTNTYKLFFKSSITQKKIWKLVPGSVGGKGYRLPEGLDRATALDKIADYYISNVRTLGGMCKEAGVSCSFFLQPLPYMHYDRTGDIIAVKGDVPEITAAYAKIKAALADNPAFMPLDAVFAKAEAMPYVDAYHYSPYGNRVLAEKILDHLRPSLAP